jgi:Holliday junction resolvase
MVELVDDRVVRQGEQRPLPELVVIAAEEIVVEENSREQRAGRQDIERHEHDIRGFMDVMHDIGGRPWLAVERHEDQAP